MLNPSDVYVSGGSDKLLVCWTDKVTKFDASSFYNWEQDNLPLHDLDERTHLAWEKLGHPTSALTGMSFIVSGDATDSCSPLYFTTLNDCVAALPEVINYPILVEVASFGSLGGLDISNKAFGPNGSLEIINRNSSFGGAMSISDEVICAQEFHATYPNLASSIVPAGSALNSIAAGDYSVPCVAYDCLSSLMFTNSQSVADSVSAWTDERYVNPYVFTRKVMGNENQIMTASLSSAIAPWASAAPSLAEVSAIDFTPFDATLDSYDASTLDFVTNSDIEWGNVAAGGAAAAFVYFNSLDYIRVTNCNGPIYLRNFNVDSQHSRDMGIEIMNSKVFLERCSASRANKAGLYAMNSSVNLLRGFVGYRNYEATDSVRIGTPYAEKQLAYTTKESYGAGIYAENSTINFMSTYQRDIDKSTESSSLVYTDYTGLLPAPSLEALYCMARNDIGIHAVNSHIAGGRTELDGSSTRMWRDATQIFSELNTEAGIRLDNSRLENSGRIILDGNYFGLDSHNSKIFVDSLAARYNQSTGLRMARSSLTYNKDLYQGFLGTQTGGGPENYQMSQLAFIRNGSDILADQSDIVPVFTSSMPDLYQMVYTSGAFGLQGVDGAEIQPSVYAKNNSNLDLIHLNINHDALTAGATGNKQFGLFAKAENNSTITCRGSGQYANMFIGPKTWADQIHTAGLYATDNSTLKLQGPTAISQVGICGLAEDNSKLEITPHRDSNGDLLVSAFNLSNNANHTQVELHSTRACLVANKNSSILMEDLGDREAFWGIDWDFNYDFSGQPLYTSAGYVQFYPNGFTSEITTHTFNRTHDYTFQGPAASPGLQEYYALGTDPADISTGGMCVRAVGNSLVEANNVHFPTGWSNPSAVIYDFDGLEAILPGSECTRLFIWNIADNSLLKASYISVSGVHPYDAGYHGPSGVWSDTSSAPESTPDTSSLALLDYYGSYGDNAHKYGKSGIQNMGAFRLYFSTDPAVNYLVGSGAGDGSLEGYARQVFAQGYNFSGNLSATSNVAYDGSSYTSLLQTNSLGVVVASGFYYASAMLMSPDTIKVIVDDSGANTFANAKHNSVGKSGLGKVVSIYHPLSDLLGGDSNTGYTYGDGLASVNNFDLDKDN